jgi:RNA polymerase sigma-70 factor (ECF subfamily)
MILTAAMNPEMLSTTENAIARLKRGDLDGLTAILSRYQHRLYRYLLRIVQEPAAAEDLLQQTWLRLMEKIGRYDERSSFETWMFAVAHNLAIDHLRRKRSYSLDAPDDSGMAPSDLLVSGALNPFEHLIAFERGELLAAAISELPAIHREVLSLRFEEEMQLDQIADVTGVPLSTAKSRLRRALEGLRLILESQLPWRPEQ